MQGTLTSMAWTFATALGGVWLISASVVGYFRRALAPTARVALTLAGILLLVPYGIYPGAILLDVLGLVLAAVLIL
ncbi:MAG: C4-dicarboxylate ABC transporter permease, partial [Deltaproteobacteria bacterium]|nr:C4-dicarboxylate ABC transporter permease [Deltaproteobacteria bacterium]